jgi:hypothetical protein
VAVMLYLLGRKNMTTEKIMTRPQAAIPMT